MQSIGSDQIICIIPARYHSTRFPGKPLVKIQGKSLIQRTYENAKQSNLLDRVIVGTDDQRIYDHVQEFGGEVMMTSSDLNTGTDRVSAVVDALGEIDENAIIVNIQGDEPGLPIQTIDLLVNELIQNPEVPMATVVTPLRFALHADNPNVVKCTRDLKGFALYFTRANVQGAFQHLGLYGYRRNFLRKYCALSETPLQQAESLEQLKVLEHGIRIKTAIVESAAIGIDTPEDIKEFETWLCTQNSSSSRVESAPPLGKD